MSDKFTAVWASHSSISDFLQCPRAYYLKNIYKDTKTGHKINLMNPSLALGQTVHSVLESLSVIPVDERLTTIPLVARFDEEWKKVSGKKGGFFDSESEYKYKKRGEDMLKRIYNNPGPIGRKAVKITSNDLPQYWLSEEENIILCGKIDWLEYLEDIDSVNIIDFKTGRKKEDKNSLQLPIYHLLVHNCQKRKVAGASYWYLETDDKPIKVNLPDLEDARKKVLEVARKMKLARQLNKFVCPDNGCFACRDMEKVINGEAELIGIDNYRRDVYILDKNSREIENDESIIL
ncbi:MAG: PD-(D/E)XK nuclease family protein [bacterium]